MEPEHIVSTTVQNVLVYKVTTLTRVGYVRWEPTLIGLFLDKELAQRAAHLRGPDCGDADVNAVMAAVVTFTDGAGRELTFMVGDAVNTDRVETSTLSERPNSR